MPEFFVGFKGPEDRKLGEGSKNLDDPTPKAKSRPLRRACRENGLAILSFYANEAARRKYAVAKYLKDLRFNLGLADSAIKNKLWVPRLIYNRDAFPKKAEEMLNFLLDPTTPFYEYVYLYIALIDFLFSENNFFSGFQRGDIAELLNKACNESCQDLIDEMFSLNQKDKNKNHWAFTFLNIFSWTHKESVKFLGLDYDMELAKIRSDVGPMNNVYLLYLMLITIAQHRSSNYFGELRRMLFPNNFDISDDIDNILRITIRGLDALDMPCYDFMYLLAGGHLFKREYMDDMRYAFIRPQVIRRGNITKLNSDFQSWDSDSSTDQAIIFIRYWFGGEDFETLNEKLKIKNHNFVSKSGRRGSLRTVLRTQTMLRKEDDGLVYEKSPGCVKDSRYDGSADEANARLLLEMEKLNEDSFIVPGKISQRSRESSVSTLGGDQKSEESKRESGSIISNGSLGKATGSRRASEIYGPLFEDRKGEAVAYVEYAKTLSRSSSVISRKPDNTLKRKIEYADKIISVLTGYINGTICRVNIFRKHKARARAVRQAVINNKHNPVIVLNILKNQKNIMNGIKHDINPKILDERWSVCGSLNNTKRKSYYNAIVRAIMLTGKYRGVVDDISVNKIKWYKSHRKLVAQYAQNLNNLVNKQTEKRKNSSASKGKNSTHGIPNIDAAFASAINGIIKNGNEQEEDGPLCCGNCFLDAKNNEKQSLLL